MGRNILLLALLVISTNAGPLLDSLSHFEIVELRHPENSGRSFTTKFAEDRIPRHVGATEVVFTAEGKNFHLQLERNQHLIAADYQHIVYDTAGNIVSRSQDFEHCHYLGKVVGDPNSMVSFSSCNNDFVGHIVRDGITYHLETEDGKTIFYRPEHMRDTGGSCGTGEEHPITSNLHSDGFVAHSRAVEQVTCLEKWIEVGLCYDTVFAGRFSNSPPAELAAIYNQVHALYYGGGFTPRIGVTIKMVVAYPFESDRLNASAAIRDFGKWRVTKPEILGDMFELVSGHTLFQTNILGKNFLNVACQDYWANAGISARTDSVSVTAAVIAHEMGHGLGYNHDDGISGTACDNSNIMAPVISNPPSNKWSSCSKSTIQTNVCTWTCLDNIPPPQTSFPCNPFPEPCFDKCGVQPDGCGGTVTCPKTCTISEFIKEIAFTDRHNHHRAKTFPVGFPPDSPLLPLKWSNEMAESAQAAARQCTGRKNSPVESRLAPNAGENVEIVTSFNSKLAETITDMFASTVNSYNYADNSGSAASWLQLVWSSTTKFGCGLHTCNSNAEIPSAHYRIVCHYSPAGAIIGQRPYVSTATPICKTCSELNVQCGDVNPQCSSSSSINCGTCPSGKTCVNGGCVCIPTADCTGKCGVLSDGCGGTVTCPSCGAGNMCNANNLCVCSPKSNAEACGGMTCGVVDDGCGGTINCGTCAGNEACTSGACTCVTDCPCNPQFCAQSNHECGSFVDPACNLNRDCGSCPAGKTCNNGRCECAPAPNPCASIQCGAATVSDGCGGQVTCAQGACPGNQNCVANTCQPCVPRTCADNGLHCQPFTGFPVADLDDGCGGTLDCSAVPECPSDGDIPKVCSKAPNVNVYDCAACVPNQNTCESAGFTDCGSVDNGCRTVQCGPPQNAGGCPLVGQVCQSGRCVCSATRKTCSEVGRECGNFYNGCELETCSHPAAAAGSDCPAGLTCGNDGLCVPVCQPFPCPASGCGFQNDGCGNFIQCGDTCPPGQSCLDGVCADSDGCVPNCHSLAHCTLGQCYCPEGFSGDGVNSCVAVPPLTPGLGGWDLLKGDIASQTTWRMDGGSIVYSGNTPSTLIWTSTETALENLKLRVGGGPAGLSCSIYNFAKTASLGIRIDADGYGFHWTLYADGTAVFYLPTRERTWVGYSKVKWTPAANGVNKVRMTFIEYPDIATITTRLYVNDVDMSGFKVKSNLVPPAGPAYIAADSPTTFENCFLVTSTSVQISLAKCVEKDAFLQYVADIAQVPKDSIQIESYECNGKRSAKELTAIVTFSSTPTFSSEAIASQFSASVTKGLNPQVAAGGMNGAQPISFTPAIAALPAIGAALSAGAIAGIAIAGAVVVAGASAGIAVAVKKNKQRKKEYSPETEVEMDKTDKPQPPPRSAVRRTIYNLFTKKPGVNVNVETVEPDQHHSITARAQA